MFGLLLAFAVEAGWRLWFRFHVGFHVLLWKLCWLASLSRDVTGELKSLILFDAGFAMLRRLHGLWFTRVLFVSAGLGARFKRAVLPAFASEEEFQASFKRVKSESARTRASF